MPATIGNPDPVKTVQLLTALGAASKQRATKAIVASGAALSALVATLLLTTMVAFFTAEGAGPFTNYASPAREIYYDRAKLLGSGYVCVAGFLAGVVECALAIVMLRRGLRLADESAATLAAAWVIQSDPDAAVQVHAEHLNRFIGVPLKA